MLFTLLIMNVWPLPFYSIVVARRNTSFFFSCSFSIASRCSILVPSLKRVNMDAVLQSLFDTGLAAPTDGILVLSGGTDTEPPLVSVYNQALTENDC